MSAQLSYLWLMATVRRSQATNADYANRLYQSPMVKESKRFTKPKLSQTAFTIEHYAGGVCFGTL